MFYLMLCCHSDFISLIPVVGFLLHGSAGPLTARLGGAVLLPCFVDRPLPLEELEVDWRRTDSDTIVHLFQEGQSRPESQGDAYRGRAHFFSQEIPKGNFSLLLQGVRTADAGVYKCVVYTEQEQLQHVSKQELKITITICRQIIRLNLTIYT
uniref:Ig-like domain-containing protein n=1 Tax=Paramormyrops kingsleyae TaxID=1676925 RepID=A0A3B3SWP0_9TELE